MIGTDERLQKICRNYHLVENYMQARFDKENKWDLHHRREIDEMKSRQQLIDEGNYYDVEPEELIFLTHDEHIRLHHNGKKMSNCSRDKMSNSAKCRTLNGMSGKQHSEETKNKMSNSHTGSKHWLFGKHWSEETKNKMSENRKGTRWWNNGKITKHSKECPGEGFVLGRLHKINKQKND